MTWNRIVVLLLLIVSLVGCVTLNIMDKPTPQTTKGDKR